MSNKNQQTESPPVEHGDRELAEIIKRGLSKQNKTDYLINQLQEESDPSQEDSELNRVDHGELCQWTTPDGTRFIPSHHSVNKLPPGYYYPNSSASVGCYAERLEIKTEGLLNFPNTNSNKVIEEIRRFWNTEKIYRKHNLSFKRGILLWGPPGSGKTCTLMLAVKDVVERGGIALSYGNTFHFTRIFRSIKEIQPETPLVVVLEDIDAILARQDESAVLNILDGIENVDKTLFIATTNYPEHLGPRIVNRPSRFDRRYKIPLPDKKDREYYIDHLIATSNGDVDSYIDRDRWVEDTDGMTISHIKELFVAVAILNYDYNNTIESLRLMTEEDISSNDDRPCKPFGFSTES